MADEVLHRRDGTPKRQTAPSLRGDVRIEFIHDDGGRWAAGYRPRHVGDCLCRAAAIAMERPYKEVYEELTEEIGWSPGKGHVGVDGLYAPRPDNERALFREYLAERGWHWTPTMRIGSGCKVHLRADELPSGRLIVSVSRHLVAVINGVVHDTFEDARDGKRCVYGYFSQKTPIK